MVYPGGYYNTRLTQYHHFNVSIVGAVFVGYDYGVFTSVLAFTGQVFQFAFLWRAVVN